MSLLSCKVALSNDLLDSDMSLACDAYSWFDVLVAADLELKGRTSLLVMMKFMKALILWDCRRTF